MNRIIALRPFADKADFLKRVNQEAINARQHVGQKLLARFQFDRVELPRTRNVDYACNQFGLHIEVPYSAWDGWPVGSDHQRGIVWDFNRDTHKFTIRFPPTDDWVCDDIGLSWAELFALRCESAVSIASARQLI